MKKLLSGISLVLVLILALNSCADPESTELLTDGIWKFSNLTTDSDDAEIQEFVNIWKISMTDATMEFQEGGDYIMTYLIGEPEMGTWTLVGDDQLIITSEASGAPITGNIQDLTEDKLKYIATLPTQELGTFSVTFSWKK